MPLRPETARRWKELAVLLPAWLMLMYGINLLTMSGVITLPS